MEENVLTLQHLIQIWIHYVVLGKEKSVFSVLKEATSIKMVFVHLLMQIVPHLTLKMAYV
jgi:hypothetical protein